MFTYGVHYVRPYELRIDDSETSEKLPMMQSLMKLHYQFYMNALLYTFFHALNN